MADKIEYLTPTEIIDKYPELRLHFGWSAKDIGLLFKFRLLHGYYDPTRRKAMIKEDSVRKLVRYANEQIENQKIKLF